MDDLLKVAPTKQLVVAVSYTIAREGPTVPAHAVLHLWLVKGGVRTLLDQQECRCTLSYLILWLQRIGVRSDVERVVFEDEETARAVKPHLEAL